MRRPLKQILIDLLERDAKPLHGFACWMAKRRLGTSPIGAKHLQT